MQTLPGTILLCVIGLFLLYRVLVYTVRIPYENISDEVIRTLAYRMVTSSMDQSEVCTRDGSIRSSVQKKIEKKTQELIELHQNEFDYIIQYLRKRRLASRNGRVRKINTGRIVYALRDYVIRDRWFIFRNLESDVMTLGISPEQFLDLKRNVREDLVGVYVICNVTQRKYYVGQAKRLYFRVWQHFTGHGNGDVYADYKYGDRFIIRFISLYESGYTDLDRLERDMIQYYNAFTTGYNKTVGNKTRITREYNDFSACAPYDTSGLVK